VRSIANSVWADGIAATELLTAGAGAYAAGSLDEVDGSASHTNLTNEYTEVGFSIEFRTADLVATDEIELRAQHGVVPFDFYDAASIPVITITVPASSSTNQRSFRLVNDDGSESGATFAQDLNTILLASPNTIYRCRIGIDNPGTAAEPAETYRIQYQVDGGGYSDLRADNTDVRLVLSANFADLDATTERLDGAQTFQAGYMIEGSGAEIAESGSITLLAGQETEIEFAFEVVQGGLARCLIAM
jgi:hypothetical protein